MSLKYVLNFALTIVQVKFVALLTAYLCILTLQLWQYDNCAFTLHLQFTCLLSEPAKKLRDTPVFQCLQQLISLPDASVAYAMDLPPQDIERMIFSLASALSAKLYVVSRGRQPKSPARPMVIQEKVKTSSGARRVSQHSVASQGSLQPGIMDRMGTSSARYSSKADSTQLYRRIFQKLGTVKINLLMSALSQWLGSPYKREHSVKSISNLSMSATVAETSLSIHVPGTSAHTIVQLCKLTITGMGSLDKIFRPHDVHSRMQLQGQLFMQLNGVFVHLSAVSEKLLAIMIMQAIHLPLSELPQAHSSLSQVESEVQVQATPNSDFGYSVVHCFEEMIMLCEQDDVHNVNDAHQFKPASPFGSQHISEVPSDAIPLLPEPAVHFMIPSLSSRDERNATSPSSTVEDNRMDFQRSTFSAISATLQLDIAELQVLAEVETLQSKVDLTQISALCKLSTSRRGQEKLSSPFGGENVSPVQHE